jgi:hypothetical protein
MRGTTRLLEGGDLIVEFLPPASKNMGAGYDDVNLLRPSLERAVNLSDPFG